MNSKISIDFGATSVYLSSIATSLVLGKLASASIISNISADILGSLVIHRFYGFFFGHI
jgi:hypothetical protein